MVALSPLCFVALDVLPQYVVTTPVVTSGVEQGPLFSLLTDF